MGITGRDAKSLAEAWEAGPRTYLGLQVAGFPNLFSVTGPGSPSVLCNMPVAIEQHAEWIADCIAHMRAHGLERIETTPEAVDNWVEQVNAAASATLLPLATSSWCLGGIGHEHAGLAGHVGAPGQTWPMAPFLIGNAILAVGYTIPLLRPCWRGLGEIDVALTHSCAALLCGSLTQGEAIGAPFPWLVGLPKSQTRRPIRR
jgi:hypothetical protein